MEYSLSSRAIIPDALEGMAREIAVGFVQIACPIDVVEVVDSPENR